MILRGASLDEEHKRQILSACSGKTKRRKLINRKTAMKILDVSAPTFLKLIKLGKIREFKLSPRKIRFCLDEVQTVAQGQYEPNASYKIGDN